MDECEMKRDIDNNMMLWNSDKERTSSGNESEWMSERLNKECRSPLTHTFDGPWMHSTSGTSMDLVDERSVGRGSEMTKKTPAHFAEAPLNPSICCSPVQSTQRP